MINTVYFLAGFLLVVLAIGEAVLLTNAINRKEFEAKIKALTEGINNVAAGTNSSFARTTEFFKGIEKKIQSSHDRIQHDLKLSIQSKTDSIKSRVEKIEDTVGDKTDSWQAVIVKDGEAEELPSAYLPTLSQRLVDLENFLGIKYTHVLHEDRGYEKVKKTA